VTKAVRCECGVLFHCGTAGAYYLHRSCFFLLFINHNLPQNDRFDPDPHHIDRFDPDPHQSERYDPDPHQIER
jgi:hypothetical protein